MTTAARSPATPSTSARPRRCRPRWRCGRRSGASPTPAWPVCGLPDVLYSDHGSDFTSHHLEQVGADLRIQLINSTAGVPQGRGKIERLFGTITTELLPTLPGYLPPAARGPGEPAAALARRARRRARPLSSSSDYHARAHSETSERAAGALGGRRLAAAAAGIARAARPAAADRRQAADRAPRRDPLPGPALPRPDARRVRRRAGHRPLRPARPGRDPRLPRRPVPVPGRRPELADQTISLRELQAARTARRRAAARRSSSSAAASSTTSAQRQAPTQAARRRAADASGRDTRSTPRLRRYRED